MGKAEQTLAKRIRGPAVSRGIERAVVKAVDPLVIEIGGVAYSSQDWRMYEPIVQVQKVTLEQGALSGTAVMCTEGNASSISFATGNIETCVAASKYKVGDMLAVQETDGGTAFIILCHLREVL